MSDAIPLPPRPNREQYKKLAKDFQHASKSGDPGGIRDWAAHWAETTTRLRGVEITPQVRRRIEDEAERIEHRWRKFKETNARAARCTLADPQFFFPPRHGFPHFPKLSHH